MDDILNVRQIELETVSTEAEVSNQPMLISHLCLRKDLNDRQTMRCIRCIWEFDFSDIMFIYNFGIIGAEKHLILGHSTG